MSALDLSVYPSRAIDVSDWFGAGPGCFVLREYAGPDGKRYTFGGEPEGEGISLPTLALPALQLLAGGAQTFISGELDFTEGGLSVIGPSPMPGFWAIPLSMRLIATEVTATAGPTLTVGNGPGIDPVGSYDNMGPLQGGWPVASVPWQIEIAGTSAAPLVDLGTAQIQVNVLTPASGGSFIGRIAMVLELIEAF